MEDWERPTAELRRMLQEERRRLDYWLTHIASALARNEQRLTAIEARMLTPAQWLKILGGLILPLGALLLTGNVDIARMLMP